MSGTLVFLCQFYVNFQKNDFDYVHWNTQSPWSSVAHFGLFQTQIFNIYQSVPDGHTASLVSSARAIHLFVRLHVSVMKVATTRADLVFRKYKGLV